MVKPFLEPTKPKCQQEYGFLFARSKAVIAFTMSKCFSVFIRTNSTTFNFKFNLLSASAHHKCNQKHYGKQIQNHTLACATATSHSELFFHCFCKYWKSLELLSCNLKIRKVFFNTHKIKPRKEYGILKQKNNRNGFYISFSCFKIPYPFWRTSIFRINFFGFHFRWRLLVT